jgi:hypothetical protein
VLSDGEGREIVAAAVQAVDLVVGHRAHPRTQLGALAEELLAVVGAVVGAEGLELAVHGAGEGARQRLRVVACEQRVPYLRNSAVLQIPDDPDNLVTGRTTAFLTSADDVSVSVVVAGFLN